MSLIKEEILELVCSKCDEIKPSSSNTIPNCYYCKKYKIYEDCDYCSNHIICKQCSNHNINYIPNLTKCNRCNKSFCDDCVDYNYIAKCGSCNIFFCGSCTLYYKEEETEKQVLPCFTSKSKKCYKFLCNNCINNLGYNEPCDEHYSCNSCFKYYIKDLTSLQQIVPVERSIKRTKVSRTINNNQNEE